MENAIIEFDNRPAGTLGSNNSENNKFKFKILIPNGTKTIKSGGKYTEYLLGCPTEELRKEWIFNL